MRSREGQEVDVANTLTTPASKLRRRIEATKRRRWSGGDRHRGTGRQARRPSWSPPASYNLGRRDPPEHGEVGSPSQPYPEPPAEAVDDQPADRILAGIAVGFIGAVVVLYLRANPSGSDERPRTRPQWLTRQHYPFDDRWLEIDGHTVHYVDEGNGPVLLFLHGNPTWSFLYRDIIRRLRDGFRCIAVDYPGFGLSSAAEGYGFTPREHAAVVEQLVMALDLRDITLVVHDWGGPIGLGMAGRQTERVSAFVITNTWAWPARGDRRLETFAAVMGGPVGRFLIRYFNAFVNVLVPVGTEATLSSEEMRAYRGPFPTHGSRRPVEVLPRAITESESYLTEVEAGLPALSGKPALIIWGAKDPAFQERHRDRFERIFPNHRTVVLPNARHFVQEDEPARIATAIRRFLTGG